jgi:hypothetical protein
LTLSTVLGAEVLGEAVAAGGVLLVSAAHGLVASTAGGVAVDDVAALSAGVIDESAGGAVVSAGNAELGPAAVGAAVSYGLLSMTLSRAQCFGSELLTDPLMLAFGYAPSSEL